jgi:ATP-binding protein involved in chromosome partitioning
MSQPNPPHPPQVPQRPTTSLPGVKHVIAVGAGKGGVGKSTVALLAAEGLRRRGARVALLDGDVYGPSLPKLTGTEDKQLEMTDDGRINGVDAGGFQLVSIGHMITPDQAVIWRGPMAQKYLTEFLERTNWGEIDYLIVDLPPGTGDVPLSLAQSIPLTGALIVCTPQDVALADAIRALRMYQKLGVDTLGIVENMSYYICPHCGKRDEIFSHGGAEKAAQALEVAFLGAIPLNIALRAHGDAGRPRANFDEVEPHILAAVEEFLQNLVQAVERQAQKSTPLPQIKMHGE